MIASTYNRCTEKLYLYKLISSLTFILIKYKKIIQLQYSQISPERSIYSKLKLITDIIKEKIHKPGSSSPQRSYAPTAQKQTRPIDFQPTSE